MNDFDPIVRVELPLLWGAALRLFPDGTVTLLTSEGEARFTDEHIDQVGDLIARAQRMRTA